MCHYAWLSKNIFITMQFILCECVGAQVVVRERLAGVSLSFHPVGPRAQTPGVSLGSRRLHPGHLLLAQFSFPVDQCVPASTQCWAHAWLYCLLATFSPFGKEGRWKPGSFEASLTTRSHALRPFFVCFNLCVCVLFFLGGAHVPALPVWSSEDNLQKLILSFHLWIPEVYLRPPGWM